MSPSRRPDFLFASTYPIRFDERRLADAPLGGSETALVEVSRRLAARGLAVEVYAPDPAQGTRRGIRWGRVSQLEQDLASGATRPRVLVICRDAALAPLARRADMTWIWLQDMPMEGHRKLFRRALPLVDRILCISDYQLQRFARVFHIPAAEVDEKFCRTRNGLDLTNHAWLRSGDLAGGRIPGRCVYASAPFRGLEYLLDAWPRIRAGAPGATLEILGGMVTYDQPDDPFAHLYARARDLDGVTVTGAVPQRALLESLRRAELLLYPCCFREAGCIVLQMALACGTVPVTSDIACLPEYVGDQGVVVPGNPRGGGDAAKTFVELFVSKSLELLNNKEEQQTLRARCEAHETDWGPVLDDWIRRAGLYS